MKKWILALFLVPTLFFGFPAYVMSPYYALFPCFNVELYNELVAIDLEFDQIRAERLAREAKLAQRK